MSGIYIEQLGELDSSLNSGYYSILGQILKLALFYYFITKSKITSFIKKPV